VRPWEDAGLCRRFAVRVESFVEDELMNGTDPFKLGQLLICLAAEIAKEDPEGGYPAVVLFAEFLRDVASRSRS
jgi:hypothetical protein